MSDEKNITASQESIAATKASNDGKKSRTFGNKMFDFAVWAPIQWVAVWVFSLVIAKSATGDGKLSPLRNWGTEKLTPVVNKLIQQKDRVLKNEKSMGTLRGSTGAQWAETATLIGALSLGGTLFVPLTKYLEDRRQKIASWFDKVFGKEAVDESLIKQEPHQTWGSMLKGRMAALLMAYTILAAVGIKNIGKVEKNVGENAAQAFIKHVPKKFALFGKTNTGKWNEASVQSWSRLGVLDLFLTAAAASMHYATSRFFAAEKNISASPEVPMEMAEPIAVAATDKKPGASHYSKNLRPKSDSWLTSEMNSRQQETPRGLV